MGKSLNKCQFIGRLGKDPEMRYTPGGAPVTSFSIAVDHDWKDASGNRQSETEWVNCVAWNKLGEICNQYLAKSSRVYVEGRMQTRSWQTDDGITKYRTEIILTDMMMLDNKPRDAAPTDADGDDGDEYFDEPAQTVAPPRQVQPSRAAQAPSRQAPVAQPARNGTGPARRNAPTPIESDEDLPF